MTAIAWSPPDGQYILGAGRIFLREHDDADMPKGQRFYAAETADLVVNITSEEVVLNGVDSAVAQVLERVRTSITRTGRTSFRQISDRTLKTFWAATQATQSESADTGISEAHSVSELGVQIQLGMKTTGAPAWGYRHITITSIVRTSDSEPLVLDTDYVVDTDKGQIKILTTSTVLSAAAVGSPVGITVTFNVAAYTQSYLETSASQAASRIYEMWFEADNTRGPNKDYYFPRVDLGPEGDLALKSRTEFQMIPVSFMILEPGIVDGVDLEAAYIIDQSVAS